MDIEYQSVEAIQAYQEELLRKQMHYLAEHSPYYKRMFESFGIDIESIRTIDDLVRIPFTEKKTCNSTTRTFSACRAKR